MTTATSLIASASAELRESETSSKRRVGMLEELRNMSRTMVKEEGLLNHAQAALILDISTRRVGELVDLGKLSGFEFLGRAYVSLREVVARRATDIKAGRPARKGIVRIKTGLKIAAQADFPSTALEILFEGEIEKEKKRRGAKK